MGILSNIQTQVYRRLKYLLLRPAPPKMSDRFTGPVVVVGSAPSSNKPAGWDETFKVITVNGSQAVTQRWGIASPDIAFLQFSQIEGQGKDAIETRRVLNGLSSRLLYILLWRDGQERLINGLRAFDYRYDDLRIINRYERMALLDHIGGIKGAEINAESKCSNGMNAVLFAFHNGAPAVIITGINPDANGHVYNQNNATRLHKDMDRKVLGNLLSRGYRIYTADPSVSGSLGIPLWKGSATAL